MSSSPSHLIAVNSPSPHNSLHHHQLSSPSNTTLTTTLPSYQVRFSLLQAAHYGAPQDRLRFFLVAARSGRTLPHLPQPTHDLSSLPVKCGSIKMPLELAGGAVRIEAVNPGTGRAPHRAVTIGDAIGDLRRFHWYVCESCARGSRMR